MIPIAKTPSRQGPRNKDNVNWHRIKCPGQSDSVPCKSGWWMTWDQLGGHGKPATTSEFQDLGLDSVQYPDDWRCNVCRNKADRAARKSAEKSAKEELKTLTALTNNRKKTPGTPEYWQEEVLKTERRIKKQLDGVETLKGYLEMANVALSAACSEQRKRTE